MCPELIKFTEVTRKKIMRFNLLSSNVYLNPNYSAVAIMYLELNWVSKIQIQAVCCTVPHKSMYPWPPSGWDTKGCVGLTRPQQGASPGQKINELTTFKMLLALSSPTKAHLLLQLSPSLNQLAENTVALGIMLSNPRSKTSERTYPSVEGDVSICHLLSKTTSEKREEARWLQIPGSSCILIWISYSHSWFAACAWG